MAAFDDFAPGASEGAPGGESPADALTRPSAGDSPSADPTDGDRTETDPDTARGSDGAAKVQGDPLAEAAQDGATSSEPRLDANGDEAGGADSHEHRVELDLEELTAKAEKAEEYLELAQRTKADFENYRRRASREAGLALDRGIAKLAKELLPAIDNLDRAVQAAETFATGSPEEAAAEAESQLASGIKLVHADVLAALARVGIEPFSPAGEPFDPQWHEAVAQHAVEGRPSGTVVEVYQQGFRLGETVLRPARVLVAA